MRRSMWRVEQSFIRGAAAIGLALASLAAGADEAAFRYSAPITVAKPAPFVQLPLPASAYGRAQQGDLRDLRLVDSRGERVPFALLAPRAAEPQTTEQLRDAALFALPTKPVTGSTWTPPVEVTVQGDRITVNRRGGSTVAATEPGSSVGWLFDLGERKAGDPVPESLRLAWSGPAEFNAAFSFDVSDDLRTWRPGGSGQVMVLAPAPSASTSAASLTQALVTLPGSPGRFVRLVWADASTAPTLTGAKVIAPQHSRVALDAPAELTLSPEPTTPTPAPTDEGRRALSFDLGGVLPVVQLDLRLAPGTRVAPVRVQARTRSAEPWRDVAGAVFYRLERDGASSVSPPLALQVTARYLRVIPDERAAMLDPAATKLVVRAALASIVFAAQGQPPFALLAGSADASPSALPVGTLVPSLEDERARFGQATLGEWAEVKGAADQARSQERQAALRPWLLWAVLLAGVAGLGFMVWRLARGGARR